ncbi:unnamed protein product [Arctogadus glacialis]
MALLVLHHHRVPVMNTERDRSAAFHVLVCPDGTFKEGLSGQKQCSACTKCVTGQEVKKFCTPKSDTECEAQDGFFCKRLRAAMASTSRRSIWVVFTWVVVLCGPLVEGERFML